MTTLQNLCVLTGLPIIKVLDQDEKFVTYQNRAVGTAKVSWEIISAHQNQTENNFKYPILAGICRQGIRSRTRAAGDNFTVQAETHAIIFYPKDFQEKVRYLLTHLYDHGGKEHKPVMLNSYHDYTLCFAENGIEFESVLSYLIEDKYWIKFKSRTITARDMYSYRDIYLTDFGLEEAEKDKPKIPMIGLVSQEITTGDYEKDQKINHASKLFWSEPQTKEHMRSACVALAAVLEPLRDELCTNIHHS